MIDNMTEQKTITISANEVRELYALMEELQNLFHQSMYYEDSERVKKFADMHYPTIKKAYYETLWELLPDGDKDKIENS